jgi:hypothetical protein
MFTKTMLAFNFLLFSSLSIADHRPHFDLEMTAEEMKVEIDSNKTQKALKDSPSITLAMKRGERLSKWLKEENLRRPESLQLRLTNPMLRRGIPIDQPSIYSDKTIEKDMNNLWGEIPDFMKDAVDGGKFPASLPIDDETFLGHARKLNKIYESATRFKMLEPYRESYKDEKTRDVRGYYFLKQNNWTALRLKNEFSKLEETEKKQVSDALMGICINHSGAEPACQVVLKEAIRNNSVDEFYLENIKSAEENWNQFYYIPDEAKRTDITWSESMPNLASIPFTDPKNQKIKNYLQVNIEEEWAWKGWELKLVFGQYKDAPKVKFKPGVTPHVNGLGGNTIVMDENMPVEEYSSKWTIRHEFGHVLGFPDCYHEFYDDSIKAYVNYQLDVTDLMCSRAGDINQRLFDEMRRMYLKP